MESYSTLDPKSPGTGAKPAMTGGGAKSAELRPEQTMQQNISTRGAQASVSAALAAARAETTATLTAANHAAGVRFPGEDGGRSLAEMAQRDLDAALQLLADRAQYITGASGAAIALRRYGKNDMLCRASTGSNAPELGALLSTEFGLSGESVRTRQPLRCDDAERDVRVNREVCREMGIASVVVMPVVNDDEVLGVFELFSGKANAFGARDVSAVERLSEMVETAVRLAQATERLPERLKMPEVKDAEILEDQVLEDQVLDGYAPEELVLEETVLEVAVEAGAETLENIPTLLQNVGEDAAPSVEGTVAAPREVAKGNVPENDSAAPPAAAPQSEAEPVAAPDVVPPKKKLFWSAAVNPAVDAGKLEEPDQSHVPPVLRSLHKCAACGFPVSAGRVLCVECEEKKWRGQLRVPKPVAPRQGAVAAIAQPILGASGAEAPTGNKDSMAALEALRHPKAGSASSLGLTSSPGSASAAPSAKGPAWASGSGSSNGPVAVAPRTEVRAFAAAAHSTAGGAAMPSTQRASSSASAAASSAAIVAPPALKGKESKEVASSSSSMASGPAPSVAVRETAAAPPSTAKVSSPEFVLSAGLKPSQSWLAANKYMIGALLVVAAVVVAVLILH
jgi:GAF domain-containing protein